MDYLETAKKHIREQWFSDHDIKLITGEDGFQKIIFGEPGTSMYQVNYVLSGNMVFISGDLGVAAYALTGPATVKEISRYNLSYFTTKLTASERDKYDFDEKLAIKQITSYFKDWCDVESITELSEEEKELYDDLIFEANQHSYPEHFSNAVFNVYQATHLEWFDSDMASCIADCGGRLSYSVISYWVGLQMIAELLQLKEKAS